MPKRSELDHFRSQLRHRAALGYTHAELAAWLELQGISVHASTVWRFLNPGPTKRPRGDVKKRHRQWREQRREGQSLADIAKSAGVTRQAVHEALKRLGETDTLAP